MTRFVQRAAFLICITVFLCIALTPPSSRAAEPAAPVAFMSAFTGPIERIEAFAQTLGLPLPGFLQREGLERTFSFIGKGGIRGDGPLGMLLGPGKADSDEPDAIILIPVNPDAATLDSFKAMGAVPVEGSEDTITLGGFPVRRTDGFVMFGGNKAWVTAAEPKALGTAGAGDILGEIVLDLNLLRKSNPKDLANLLKSMDTPEPDENHSAKLGRELAKDFFETKLDRMQMTLSQGPGAVHLRTAIEPFAPPHVAPFPKPAFPKECVGRVDIVYPAIEDSKWIGTLISMVIGTVNEDHGFGALDGTGVTLEKLRAAMAELSKVGWGADAISIAVEAKDGKVVYHQVNQYRKNADFTARMLVGAREFSDLGEKMHDKPIEISKYTEGGVEVTRILFPTDHIAIDFVDEGTTVRIVVAADVKKRVASLAKVKPEGNISSVCSGAVDPGALLKAISQVPGSPTAGMPKALVEAFSAAIGGQEISWTTSADGKAAVIDLLVPETLIKVIGQFTMGPQQ